MKKVWLILSACCSLSICLGQTIPDPRRVHYALPEFLNVLEATYGVSFSYVDETISGKSISYHFHGHSTLPDVLESLQRQTILHFQSFEGDYVVIRPFLATDSLDVSGFVMDENQNPLPSVVVLTQTHDRGAITDSSGYFSLKSVPFFEPISFHHIGYTTMEVSVSELWVSDSVYVSLSPVAAILDELIVKDYLTVGITKERKDMTLFPPELKLLPGLTEPDILQSIQQAPGVLSPYETATGIHVRGGSPDQNLVLWNGIKTYSQGHFFGMLSAFNPYLTSEVNFIKSGTSAAYGDRVSSVIEIKSEEKIPTQVEGGAGTNMLYSDVFLKLPIIKNKLSISGSARRSFTDAYQSFTYQQLSSRVFQNTKITNEPNGETEKSNRFFFKDFTGSIIYLPSPRSKLVIHAIYNKDNLNFLSENTTSQQSFQDLLYTENNGYNGRYEQKLGEKTTLNVSAFYTKYLLEYQFKNTENDTTDTAVKKNLISDYGTSVSATHAFSKVHKLDVGYRISTADVRYAFENYTPAYRLVLDADHPVITTHAGYAEYQYDQHGTFVSAGARFNHYSEINKSYLEPRVYMQKRIFPHINLSASGEYRTQTTSQIKESVVSDLSLENQVWTQASKGKFPVITSYQGTIGASFNRFNWLIDFEAYRKELSGVTTLTFGFLNPVDNNFRTGSSSIYGTDVLVKKQFDHYKSWVSYSFIQTENRFKGINNDQSFPGNWNIEHTFRWSHFYDVKNFQLALGWLFHTGKSYTEVTSQQNDGGPISIVYGALNGTNLPVYHRLDFSAMYEFHDKKRETIRYRIGLSVLNTYGRRNILNREIRTTPSLNNELIDTRIYSLKVTPNVTFRVFW